MKKVDEEKYDRLCFYRSHLARIITDEAREYGWTFDNIAKAHQLSRNEREEREEMWDAYYTDVRNAWQKISFKRPKDGEIRSVMTVERPLFPDARDFSNYLEYLRIDKLIRQMGTSVFEKAFF